MRHPKKTHFPALEVSASAAVKSTFPIAPSTASPVKQSKEEAAWKAEDPEPAWLQALRLLEAAAEKPTQRLKERLEEVHERPLMARSTPALGYFPAPEPLEDDHVVSEEEKLEAYLDGFSEEPAWAKAIRILESVPSLGQSDSRLQAAPVAAPVAAAPSGVEDRGREVRMRSYQAMLREHARNIAASSPELKMEKLIKKDKQVEKLKDSKIEKATAEAKTSHAPKAG